MSSSLDTSYVFSGQSLVGQRFNRFAVIRFAGCRINTGGDRTYYWECRCDCGTVKTVSSNNLKAKGESAVKSCGCLGREVFGTMHVTHGHCSKGTRHRLYQTWLTMRERCNNPNCKKYKYYGGRGIKVCPEWDDFPKFLEDMEPTWKEGLMIERNDNNGAYSASNCRWATRSEQMNNQRSNRKIEFQGEVMNLSQWGVRLGRSPLLIHKRLSAGWSVHDALTVPARIKAQTL